MSISVGRRFARSVAIDDFAAPVPPPAVVVSFSKIARFCASDRSTPQARATAAVSSSARRIAARSSGTSTISAADRSVAADAAPSAALPRSFCHFSRLMSALACVASPCRVNASAIAVARSERPPPISPIQVGRSPKLRTTPGPTIVAPCAVRPPSILPAPRIAPSVSSLPRPFWNEIATVSSRIRWRTERAAASLTNALHWNSTTSARATVEASVVAPIAIVRSPP